MHNFIKAFERLPNGAWRCVAPATINGPHGRIQVTEGSTFTPGTAYMGVDLAKLLEEQAAKDRQM
jgi:hypothetical protein